MDYAGIIKSEFHYQPCTEQVTHRTTQPTEDIILKRNQEVRNSGLKLEFGVGDGAEGGMWGRALCSVPFIKWEAAKRAGFDLDCPDQEIADRELMRFLKTEEGRKCLVTEDKF